MNDYSIGQLAELAGVTVRTIRYYAAEGVLPPPATAVEGRYARYTQSHLNCLRLILRLKESFLPLSEIKRRICVLSESEIESQLQSEPDSIPTSQIALSTSVSDRSTPKHREVWERVSVSEGVELHLQLPLSQNSQAKADRLLAAANSQELIPITAPHPPHPHPCNFRLHRSFDRGWGEMAFEYRWDSTSGLKSEDGIGSPDLSRCFLYEMTTYSDNSGSWEEGCFIPELPFEGWRFRDPTDGRTGSVGMETFPADQGWAWDRHKLGGKFLTTERRATSHAIIALQSYRYYCEICGLHEKVSGTHAGPHAIARIFAPCASSARLIPSFQRADSEVAAKPSQLSTLAWRYLCRKHNQSAWMEFDEGGFLQDSAGLDFGPWDAPQAIDAAEWMLEP